MIESAIQFELDPRLQGDCFLVGNFPLCQILLFNDRNFPWIILVPRITGVTEIIQLSTEQQQQLLEESGIVSRLLLHHFSCDKLNTGAIGNIVSQLHVHHIARQHSDPCWPGVVWGYGKGIAYDEVEKSALINKIQRLLSHTSGFAPAQGVE